MSLDAKGALPLAGITILELAGLHPGPNAGVLLSQLGADVIKVENPNGGDGTRALGGPVFESLNRNKRSIVVDLKSDFGRATLERLLARVDAVVEGFRPGVADRLGVGYERARALNEAVVYCSISSFGQSGPYRLRTGHDLNYMSLAGYFAAPSQVHDQVAARPKVRLSDYAGSMYAALCLSTAVLSARLSGKGCYLDVSLHDAISAWSLPAALAMRGGHYSGAGDSPSVMPDNDIYRCADGRFISLGIFENKYWAQLAELLGDENVALREPALADRKQRMARKVEVYDLLQSIFGSRPRRHWEAVFNDSEIPWSPVYQDDEALDDPHVIERRLYRHRTTPDGHQWTDLRLPVLFDGHEYWCAAPAPGLGEHTEEILTEIGMK